MFFMMDEKYIVKVPGWKQTVKETDEFQWCKENLTENSWGVYLKWDGDMFQKSNKLLTMFFEFSKKEDAALFTVLFGV
jgi:hypothetical protein